MSYAPAHLVVLHGPDYEATAQQNPDFRVCEASDDGDGASSNGGSEVVVGMKFETPPTDRGDGDDTRDAKVCVCSHHYDERSHCNHCLLVSWHLHGPAFKVVCIIPVLQYTL